MTDEHESLLRARVTAYQAAQATFDAALDAEKACYGAHGDAPKGSPEDLATLAACKVLSESQTAVIDAAVAACGAGHVA
jgi:hypothetical protein